MTNTRIIFACLIVLFSIVSGCSIGKENYDIIIREDGVSEFKKLYPEKQLNESNKGKGLLENSGYLISMKLSKEEAEILRGVKGIEIGDGNVVFKAH